MNNPLFVSLLVSGVAILVVVSFIPFGDIICSVAGNLCQGSAGKAAQWYCDPNQQRNPGACIELYKPVCGWSDPAKVQCIRYPCAQTFSNSCFACNDNNILYYTEGPCPA